jgi:hypothetical protein
MHKPVVVSVTVLVVSVAVAFIGAGLESHPADSATATVARVDRLTRAAKLRYDQETGGSVVRHQARRIASDPALLAALRSGNLPKLRAVVAREQLTPRAHISRLRIVRGKRVLADAGVVFVVAPAEQVLRAADGRPLARLQVSIQDVIGFVRFMHRNFPVDVVTRGIGAAHVRSSLPAAARKRLPSAGTTTISGRRYEVRSFVRHALGNESVKVWILVRG